MATLHLERSLHLVFGITSIIVSVTDRAVLCILLQIRRLQPLRSLPETFARMLAGRSWRAAGELWRQRHRHTKT
jgi:hypothetical protein